MTSPAVATVVPVAHRLAASCKSLPLLNTAYRNRVAMFTSNNKVQCLLNHTLTTVYPKVSGLATWSEICKWYSSVLLGGVISLFLWLSLMSFAAITLCVASQRVFIVVYLVTTQSGNFWIYPRTTRIFFSTGFYSPYWTLAFLKGLLNPETFGRTPW
jgi:hypothetical protein